MEQKFYLNDNNYITYKIINNNSTKDYIIIYLHGFYGDMDGKKGTKIEEIAKEHKVNLIKLNYLGHGTSSGKVEDYTMINWFDNIKTIIDNFSENKKLLFIGSSMGGWFSYIMGLEYKDRVKAIITFSTAIDFVSEVIEPKILNVDKNKEIVFEMRNSDGTKNGNVITKKMLEDSKKFNLLSKNKIDLNCPIRMIHGLWDTLIPYTIALKFLEKLTSNDAELLLVKNMDHRLSMEGNLDILKKVVDEVLNGLN